MFDFLTAFPPHTSITDLITSSDTSIEEILPAVAPFKILYSIHAFKHCLSYAAQPVSLSFQDLVSSIDLLIYPKHSAGYKTLLTGGIRRLSEGLTILPLQIDSGIRDIDMLVAGSLADCLSSFFKAAQDPQLCVDKDGNKDAHVRASSIDEIASCISSPAAFVERCLRLLSVAASIKGNIHADRLVYGTFASILEACLISKPIWEILKGKDAMHWLLKRLLLEDARLNNRQAISKLIKTSLRPGSRYAPHSFSASVLTFTSGQSGSSEDFVPVVCRAALEAIPVTLDFVKNTEQFYDIVMALLSSLPPTQQQSLGIDSLLNTWSTLLLRHKHLEVCDSSQRHHSNLNI